jgi:pimeloyl-ACP methyl ester carboxylesterase
MKNDAVKKPNKITYETLWKAIIRPPRDEYLEEELGSPKFIIEKKHYIRKDFELLNFQGYLMKVSMIEPEPRDRPTDIMPCVIYLHANASSRIEGLHIRRFLLKRNINLCVFDFQGSGLSEGEYISLGYNEKHQVKNIVDFVEKYPGVGKIGLWGRSMGAATALIYTSMDKRIKATVVDSPFEDFRKLAKEMVLGQIKLPGFLVEGAISIIGKSVKNRNGMDINDIKAIDAVKQCEGPVVFIHARDDELVPYHHSEDLIKNYKGKIKILKSVNGGHNARRANSLMEFVGDFFAKHLESGYKIGEYERMRNYIHKMKLKETGKKEAEINLENTDPEENEEEEEDDDEVNNNNIFNLKNNDLIKNEIKNIDNNLEDKETKEEDKKTNETNENSNKIENIEKNEIKIEELKDNEKKEEK